MNIWITFYWIWMDQVTRPCRPVSLQSVYSCTIVQKYCRENYFEILNWPRDKRVIHRCQQFLTSAIKLWKNLSEKDNCISANLSSSSQISALFCTNSLIKSFLWSPVSRGNKSPAFSEQSLNSLISNKATGKVLFSRLSQRTKLILRA